MAAWLWGKIRSSLFTDGRSLQLDEKLNATSSAKCLLTEVIGAALLHNSATSLLP